MAGLIPITVAHGDGIGPEIMEATLFILKEAGARIEPQEVTIGEKLYLQGVTQGITQEAWDSIKSTKVFLKAPITTPQGGGYRSLNVTVREALGLYANVRPCLSYAPFVPTLHPSMNLVIVRENEEDLYSGIEYQQTKDVCESVKLISRQGCERIVRFAFEYARHCGRKKVTCMTKDNIMKKTDGLFHSIFDQLSRDYSDIVAEHWIVDIGAAKLAVQPENFDVVVLPNLYGDILSDVTAQLSGSVGISGAMNIGAEAAMFEAIHGSAPRHAGKNTANPSGLLQSAIYMLVYLGQIETANVVQNAWLKTLESGKHTKDIFRDGQSKAMLGTKEFARAVARHLGEAPASLKGADYRASFKPQRVVSEASAGVKQLNGVDVYFELAGNWQEFIARLQNINISGLRLTAVFNRGAQVWPQQLGAGDYINHWRCRFESNGSFASQDQILDLLNILHQHGYEFFKAENLFSFTA
ncbi:MAG: NADP-dependent isocitrate dehydrogenase [Deltaproteobacteria bacterium]|nr:NADP-dependent isocitrate dehydrogenase [Deltaproteobacteria bacterium]